MSNLFFFGELGYLINCILPNVGKLNEKTTIHCFEDYQFILAQYCKAKFITVNFHSSIIRCCERGAMDYQYLSKNKNKNKYSLVNLSSVAEPKFLHLFDDYKKIPYPISSKPINMINKSLLFNFRHRIHSAYGNLSKEFYEDLLKKFSDYHIYNCGNLEEIHKINIDNSSHIKFQDIPYIAQNCECCILPNSGLSSMIINCNPKKVVVLLENEEHARQYNHERIYIKNFDNLSNFNNSKNYNITPARLYIVENNKLKEEDLLELIDFINS
jgi:hypothetical protein